MAMALQLTFTKKVLYKSYDSERSGKIELVKIGLRVLFIDMLCIEI